ncbi:BgTH12-04015 [Blumeria graminis f. sp. triticale]|uniref:BgTH12-04015 n=1 Tax=Blumeria graminis f. sp. triticale TaxID=1689686 RepID=A0A9W4GDJ6_BLUGR|nr:BgTH12-04015 [Blumeria graminis f. sp. triticale]
MALTGDEIDELLYLARSGESKEFESLSSALCEREKLTTSELIAAAKDDHSGNGILHMAAANGHVVIVRYLCNALASPTPQIAQTNSILSSQNYAGNTALHWAALNGHLECVKFLLDHGADPTITNHRGHDAIYEAELNGKAEVVDWVLKEGGQELDESIAQNDTYKNTAVGVAEKTTSKVEETEKVTEKMEELEIKSE